MAIMEIGTSPKENEHVFLLVSVKSKKPNSEGRVYVLRREDISSFIKKNLSPDNVIFVDSIETFVGSES